MLKSKNLIKGELYYSNYNNQHWYVIFDHIFNKYLYVKQRMAGKNTYSLSNADAVVNWGSVKQFEMGMRIASGREKVWFWQSINSIDVKDISTIKINTYEIC